MTTKDIEHGRYEYESIQKMLAALDSAPGSLKVGTVDIYGDKWRVRWDEERNQHVAAPR